MILNITAALIDHDQFDGASRLLTSVENVDKRSTMSMKAGAQFERVLCWRGRTDSTTLVIWR
jgi:hypothetical protein